MISESEFASYSEAVVEITDLPSTIRVAKPATHFAYSRSSKNWQAVPSASSSCSDRLIKSIPTVLLCLHTNAIYSLELPGTRIGRERNRPREVEPWRTELV